MRRRIRAPLAGARCRNLFEAPTPWGDSRSMLDLSPPSGITTRNPHGSRACPARPHSAKLMGSNAGIAPLTRLGLFHARNGHLLSLDYGKGHGLGQESEALLLRASLEHGQARLHASGSTGKVTFGSWRLPCFVRVVSPTSPVSSFLPGWHQNALGESDHQRASARYPSPTPRGRWRARVFVNGHGLEQSAASPSNLRSSSQTKDVNPALAELQQSTFAVRGSGSRRWFSGPASPEIPLLAEPRDSPLHPPIVSPVRRRRHSEPTP